MLVFKHVAVYVVVERIGGGGEPEHVFGCVGIYEINVRNCARAHLNFNAHGLIAVRRNGAVLADKAVVKNVFYSIIGFFFVELGIVEVV